MITYAEFIRPYIEKVRFITVRTNRHVARDDDFRAFTHYDEEQRMTDESFFMLCDAYEEWERIQSIHQQASNEIYKAQCKKEIIKGLPVSYEEKRQSLTICPSPDYSTAEHINQIAQIACMPSACKDVFYVLEQRSKGDEPEHGWHIHMSILTTYAPSKLRQFISQMLRSRGYDIPPKQPAMLVREEFNDDFREKYMKGIKNHADKDPKVKKDIILREKYGFQDYYHVEKKV